MIQAHNQETTQSELLESHALYTTFEKACDAIEKEIHAYIDNYNCRRDDPIVFEPPKREDMFDHIRNRHYVHYYELHELGYLFVIVKMIVQE